MFGTRHKTRVERTHNDRYQAVCSCGHRSWDCVSYRSAAQAGRDHEANARR